MYIYVRLYQAIKMDEGAALHRGYDVKELVRELVEKKIVVENDLVQGSRKIRLRSKGGITSLGFLIHAERAEKRACTKLHAL